MILVMLAILTGLVFSGGVVITITGIRMYRNYKEVKNDLADFFVRTDKDGNTQFSRFACDFAESAAVRIGQNVQAGIKGSLGGSTKGLNAALEQMAIEENPSLAIQKALPKSIQKNPILAEIAQRLFEKAVSGTSNNGGSETGDSSQRRFNL